MPVFQLHTWCVCVFSTIGKRKERKTVEIFFALAFQELPPSFFNTFLLNFFLLFSLRNVVVKNMGGDDHASSLFGTLQEEGLSAISVSTDKYGGAVEPAQCDRYAVTCLDDNINRLFIPFYFKASILNGAGRLTATRLTTTQGRELILTRRIIS